VILKIVPEAGYDWKKLTNESKGKPEQFLEIVGVLKEASRNFRLIFLLKLGRI
jgi:hypothetical protein